MKSKLLIALTTAASVATIMPLSLTSCNQTSPYDINIIDEDKIGYIIAVTKPYFEYHLSFKGLVAGDVISTKLAKSQNDKVKVHEDWINHAITDEEATQGFILLKIIPSDPSPSQDVFTDIFSLTFTLLHEEKVCLEKTIDNFSLDAALPTTADLFDIEETQGVLGPIYTLNGFNMDKKDDIMKCGILVIPSNIYRIADNAFNVSEKEGYWEIFNSIKWLLLDETLTGECQLHFIGMNAFTDCPFTETLYIPSTVEIIGSGAFQGCNKIRYLKFLGGADSNLRIIQSSAFANMVFGGTLTLPNASNFHNLQSYVFAQGSAYAKDATGIVIPKNITQFGTESLAGFKNITYIDLSDYTEVPSDFAPKTFYNFPDHGTIYVNNEELIQQWTDVFNASPIGGTCVFPDFAKGNWEFKVK